MEGKKGALCGFCNVISFVFPSKEWWLLFFLSGAKHKNNANHSGGNCVRNNSFVRPMTWF